MSLKFAELVGKAEASSSISSAAAKRPKRDHVYPVLTILVKTLLEIRSAALLEAKNASDKETYLKEVEVEIRLGMVIDGSCRWKPRQSGREVQLVDELNQNEFKLHFKAGIDETFCNKLKKKLKSSGEYNIVKQPLRIIRYDNNRTRWEVDGSGSVVGSSLEKKNYFSRHDVAMLSFDYDIRIDGAAEKCLQQESSSKIVSDLNRDWIRERRKQRFTYTPKAPQEPWKLDLTYVESRENSSPIVLKEIELEFELDDAIKNQWLVEQNEEKFKSLTRFFGERVLHLIDACIPCMQEEPSSETLQPLRGRDFPRRIQQLNAKILGQPNPPEDQNNRLDFIGSMPVNLTRQNLQIIQSNDYFMTEKSDGVRYLLYVVADPSSNDGRPIAVFLDRSKNIFSFRGSSAVGAALGIGTVLDGELVFNLKYKEHAFLVFDALLWKEHTQLEKSFKQRLDLVQEILQQYSTNLTRMPGISSAPVRPVNLVRKIFVHKSDGLRILLDKIRLQVGGDRTYYDTDRRNHRTDGIIFQPNGPYQICRHPGLMKWKWADLRSVDLQVSVHHDNRSLVLSGLNCSGPENSLIKCGSIGGTAKEVGVSIGAFDRYRLLAEIQEYLVPGKNAAIVEVAYDVTVGMWSYIHHRKDKAAPNYIDTVLGVFVEQAECITEEELEFSLTASTRSGGGGADSETDFQSLMSQYAKRLVQNQRARIP